EAASNLRATAEPIVADAAVTKTEENEKQASSTVEQVVETKADATSTSATPAAITSNTPTADRVSQEANGTEKSTQDSPQAASGSVTTPVVTTAKPGPFSGLRTFFKNLFTPSG
ncbi:unnamed protein product, partial [Rotaria socialis]